MKLMTYDEWFDAVGKDVAVAYKTVQVESVFCDHTESSLPQSIEELKEIVDGLAERYVGSKYILQWDILHDSDSGSNTLDLDVREKIPHCPAEHQARLSSLYSAYERKWKADNAALAAASAAERRERDMLAHLLRKYPDMEG